MNWRSDTVLDIALVITLVVATLCVRVPIAAQRQIMPAGDAFNYQHITSHLLRLDYPDKEKRLPVFPALLISTRLTFIDFIDASVAMSVVMGSLAIGIWYLIGRQLQLHRAALLLFLGLSIFDPLLIVNSIRPFGDSTFILFMALFLLAAARLRRFSSPPSSRALLGLGAAATLMMFTRYEGFLIAALVYPLLFFRLSCRQVAVTAAIPFVASLAWIPVYLSIHGSLLGLSYLSDASGTGFGEVSGIAGNLTRMLNGSKFLGAFSLPVYELGESHPEAALWRVFARPAWWFSVLALLGSVWVVIRGRWAGLTILLAGTGYALLLSWWWVYSRYVPPLSAVFYLLAAAGLSALLTAVERQGKWLPTAAAVALLATVSYGISIEVPTMHRIALNNAWENNFKGLALFTAMKDAARSKQPTAYWSDAHAFATLYLGYLSQPPSFTNPALGVYLSRHSDLTPEQLYSFFAQQRVRNFIYAETEHDSRFEPLRNLLEQRGRVSQTFTYRSTNLATGEVETVPVYQLDWL